MGEGGVGASPGDPGAPSGPGGSVGGGIGGGGNIGAGIGDPDIAGLEGAEAGLTGGNIGGFGGVSPALAGIGSLGVGHLGAYGMAQGEGAEGEGGITRAKMMKALMSINPALGFPIAASYAMEAVMGLLGVSPSPISGEDTAIGGQAGPGDLADPIAAGGEFTNAAAAISNIAMEGQPFNFPTPQEGAQQTSSGLSGGVSESEGLNPYTKLLLMDMRNELEDKEGTTKNFYQKETEPPDDFINLLTP